MFYKTQIVVDMEIILAVVCSLIVGAVAGVLFAKRGVAAAEQRSAALQEQVVALQVEKGELSVENRHLAESVAAERARAQADEVRRREEFERQLEIVKGQITQQTERVNRQSITEILKPYQEQI